MRPIDADALMREFAEFIRASNNSDFANVPTWNDAVSLLGSAPTIEPKKGKWEYIGGYGYQYRCSNCIMCAGKKTPYCPYCGARMERSEDATD